MCSSIASCYVLVYSQLLCFQKNTDQEERVDFFMSLAKDYDSMADGLELRQFQNHDASQRPTGKQYPFLLCKKGTIMVYENKNKSECLLSIKKADFSVKVDYGAKTIQFVPNDVEAMAPLVMTCKSPKTFGRMTLVLRFSSFLPLPTGATVKYFFPNVVYGTVIPEAGTLIAEALTGGGRRVTIKDDSLPLKSKQSS
eukprot:GHVS01011689.1.p1 GENE.GHVS01011689.1~~GHVS01011689.1.p1  ORF type:complete len:197 (+),score=22.54 GHVS01011689.1:49-639(+)